MAKKSVAALVIETLAQAGVERVYGVCGDSLNGITDSIRKQDRVKWVHVRHEESAAKFAASWDEPHGAWKVNRGSWVVTQHALGETLLEYNLELRVSPFPDFVVRAVLLGQLKPVMRAVAKRVERDRPPR